MSPARIASIHQTVVKIFQREPKWKTNQPTNQSLAASVAKREAGLYLSLSEHILSLRNVSSALFFPLQHVWISGQPTCRTSPCVRVSGCFHNGSNCSLACYFTNWAEVQSRSLGRRDGRPGSITFSCAKIMSKKIKHHIVGCYLKPLDLYLPYKDSNCNWYESPDIWWQWAPYVT